jgi:antitoxin CptB
MSELDRFRWQCRRGMLELDLLLAGFLERDLPQLNPQQLEILKELLDLPDNDLLDLVMGRAELRDPRCKPMLDMMRAG